MMKALKAKSVPGGFALGRASGDGNAWVHWVLWSNGGNLVDKNDKVVINSPETVKALEYAKALSETFVSGTASWNDAFNNKAFLTGEISLTNNGVSIYASAKAGAAKGEAKMKEILDDMNHSLWPIGPIGMPTEFHIAYPMMIMKYSKYPERLQIVHRIHDGSGKLRPMAGKRGGLPHASAECLRQQPGLDLRSEAHRGTRRGRGAPGPPAARARSVRRLPRRWPTSWCWTWWHRSAPIARPSKTRSRWPSVRLSASIAEFGTCGARRTTARPNFTSHATGSAHTGNAEGGKTPCGLD